MSKCYKPLYGLCTQLSVRLDKDEDVLQVPEKYLAKLCKELNNQYYTYLVISDGLCHEIVCVELIEGLLMLSRAIDDTDRQYWPCGAVVTFDGSVPSAIWDTKQQHIELPEHECPEELFTGTICNGNCTVHFKDGLAIKETPNKRQIADGVYDNPVPTYEDGKLVALAEGSNRVFIDNGCCG